MAFQYVIGSLHLLLNGFRWYIFHELNIYEQKRVLRVCVCVCLFNENKLRTGGRNREASAKMEKKKVEKGNSEESW